jgi:hypothetical protein
LLEIEKNFKKEQVNVVDRISMHTSQRLPVIPRILDMLRYHKHKYIVLHDKREFLDVTKVINQLTLIFSKKEFFK